ncbi:MAG: PBP1A family penicillin-binding protein [Clostridia bacterium]|nr:PBP1A family penicillin-binding protein [Clostridia bacterium]
MFGKKKRREDVEEYEEFSPEEGYEPFFPENEDAEAEYEPADGYEPADEYGPADEYDPDTYEYEESGEAYYDDEEEASWGVDDEEYEEDPEDQPEPRSIFRPETRKPNFVVSVLLNTVRMMLVILVLAGVAGLGALAGIAKGYVDTAPELNLIALDSQAQTSFIYDSNGQLITEYKGTENRVLVSLDAMPKRLRNAFIAVEDARFYSHNGVDLKRIAGAFLSNLTSSGTQGGSTITQQLIKNTLLSSEQSYKRKIQEAYLALQLESRYTKDQILESYLNTIYLGENYYGVQVAAQGYFGKDLGDLTLRECAILAGATNNPYYYNPRRNLYTRKSEEKDYAKVTNNRTDYVLRCMYENQFITKEQYQEALNPETASVLPEAPISADGMYRYPHYVEYAVKEIVDIFLELNGLEDNATNRRAMENKFRTGGYRVKLAIDTNIQDIVENTLQNWSKYPSLRDPSDKVFRTKNSDGTYTEIIQPQAACAVLDYRTGELKAIVGSRTAVTAKKTLNRATDMKMPVGSSIKPIAVYAPALELGASPASVVYNMPVPIAGWKDSKGKDSWPKNYGGGGYVGPETLRTAMAKSHNTAAAATLLSMVGVNRSVDFLHQLGIDDGHIDATPFGLSLGSSGITPLQMTVAFGVLANGGKYKEPISVLGISDSAGRVVWDGHQHQEYRTVFKPSTSWMIVDMLQSVVQKGTGTSAKIKGQVVGGKTGTNSDQKGVFFSGVTGYYASALWIGHDNYKALSSKSTGSGAAAPLWQAYMSKIHEGLPKKEILDGNPADYGLVKVTTCAVSGQLATEACANDAMGYGVVTDWWAKGTEPTVSCQMHISKTVCSDTGMLATSYCPNCETRGVVTIPSGHPLYNLLGGQYQSVIEEYLGSTAAISSTYCTLHNEFYQDPNPPAQDTQTSFPEARQALALADNLLATLDPSSAMYQAVQNAADYLRMLLGADYPNQAEIMSAIEALTRAMGGMY